MKNQKEFGVWMDNPHSIVVGNKDPESETMVLIGHIKGEDISPNTSEKNANHHERTIQSKFFREIAAHLTNATHIHITGTGQAQEQFIHYLADTPQFKNCKTEESTSNKMSDENLIEFITAKFS